MVATLFALTDAGVARTYYGAEESYWASDTHGESRWHGRAAEALGLRGEVDADDFAAGLAGKLPNGAVIGTVRGGVREHKAGWDLTMSAPKSLSVMALVGGDRRLIDAHDHAVSVALDYVERHAAVTRVRHGEQIEKVATGNIAIACFPHATSRPTADAPPAPQLHTHPVILNVTQRDDGEFRSLESHDLYKLQKKAGAVYHQELAAGALRLGYAVTVASDGTFDLDAVPQAVIAAFSPRAADIEAALEARGRTLATATAAEKAVATLATRAPKRAIDGAELVAAWRDQADELGFGEDVRRRIVGAAWTRAARRPVGFDDRARAADDAVAFAVAKLSERTSTFAASILEAEAGIAVKGAATHQDILTAIARADHEGTLVVRSAPGAATGIVGYATAQAVATERNMLTIEAEGRERFTSLHNPIEASQIVAAAELAAGDHDHAWTEGQRTATMGLLQSKAAITAVQGAAGTAKTSTVLKTYAQAMRDRGFTVRAVAPIGTAAQTLATAIGAEPMTVAGLFIHGAEDRHDRNVVEIVDEASLTSAHDMERLLARAQTNGTRLVLVGDTRQLGSVGAGRAFAQLQEHGMETHRLDQIVRQTNPHTLAAVEAMLAGDAAEAFFRLDVGGGAIVEHVEADIRRAKIARDFVKLTPEQRAGTLVLDPTREGRQRLTDSIRLALIRNGALGDEAVTASVLESRGFTQAEAARADSYAPGDTVTFRQRSKRHGIAPGTGYTVDQVSQNQVRLLGPKGKAITWTPSRWGADHAEAFTQAEAEFRAGDRVQFSRNNRRADRLNGMVATVLGVDPERAGMTVAMPDGTAQTLDLRKLVDRHIRPGWVQTIHSSQGATADRVLAHLESFRANTVDAASAYVAISRAREHATVYTDSRAALTRALGFRDGAQIGAIDGLTPSQQLANPHLTNSGLDLIEIAFP